MTDTVTLAGMVKIRKGKKVESYKHEPADGFVRYIQIDDLRNDNGMKYTASSGVEVNPQHVIIAWDGANAGTVGYGLSGVIGSTLARLEIDTNTFDAGFFGRFLQSKSRFLRDRATGATIPHIDKKCLMDLRIPKIPLEEQKRIVSLLDQADTLRRKRRESMELLDGYVKSVFMEMFGDPVTNPKGWDKQPIGNVADVKIGPFGSLLHKHDYVQNGIPLVNPKHLIDMKIRTDAGNSITPEKMQELIQYRLKKGDVVLGRRGEIGRCGLVTEKEDGYLCGTGSMFIRSNGTLDPVFLAHLIATPQMSAALEDKAVGITMKNLNAGTVEGFVILVPPIEMQMKWAAIIERKNKIIKAMQNQSDEMENHFRVLMQREFFTAV